MAGGASRLRRAAKRFRIPCATFSKKNLLRDLRHKRKNISNNGGDSGEAANVEREGGETAEEAESNSAKILCAICLDPLTCSGTGGQAIFTGQCMHSFHFVCIFSNVRHGSVTCPICRAHWTQLPRDLTPARLPPCSQTTDPILRILDDSIANFRVHRRSFLRSARYDDDDPIETVLLPSTPRLQLSLITTPVVTVHGNPHQQHVQFVGPSSLVLPHQSSVAPGLFLSVKLSQQQATDIVLVASPNGPHLRLLKQSMALVVFSLRSIDRLAIVTYSSAATRAFPLRLMTSNGKRTALQVIDRIFYLGEADPIEGLKKGVKILEDRSYQNPLHSILHLTDSPARSHISLDSDLPFPIHRFRIGFGFGASNGFVMHGFEEFLLRLLGGVIRETQLRIGEEGGVVMRLGELRCGEERRILMSGGVGDCGLVSVGYSFVEGEVEECLTTGEVMVGMEEKSEEESAAATAAGQHLRCRERNSNIERWDYLDPFMARRWAKHLHGYRV